MIKFLNQKKATDAEILSFLNEYGKLPLISFTLTDIDVWKNVRKEAHKRKIGPFSLNVAEAFRWRA